MQVRRDESGLLGFLRTLLATEAFVDVTLCCGGQRLRAHRVLLSASSNYLQEVLLAHPATDHTTIILDDIDAEDMRLLLDFIYTGATAVPEDRLESFLGAADTLGVTVLRERGLYTLGRHPRPPPIGILTPSPWAPRAPHSAPPQDLKTVRVASPPPIVKEASFPAVKEEPGGEETTKAWKLKERRLRDFYRQEEEAASDLRLVKEEPNPLQSLAVLLSDTNNNKPFSCGVCGKAFTARAQYTAHCKAHDASKPEQTCTHCGKIFLTRASLKVHLRTHTGEKPFQCLECGKQFSQLRNYKYHRSVHEGTREFAATCPECGKYFNDRGYLSSHMKIHRNRKEYGCEYCGKSFNQRVAYNMHVRIHTGEKPHSCQHCGKAFSRKMLLKQHLRIHTGEKPFSCVVCQKAFADRSNMTLHMRLHSGIKPYSCTVCNKSFTKKHHLKTHMNYHTGVKPYSCEKCGLRFSQSSNMRTHFKKCTSTGPQPPPPPPEDVQPPLPPPPPVLPLQAIPITNLIT
ncbi:zinc finger protein OZF [Halyomorpha halys]|uniref:zinc finger protein OZF n=1 Tax=Halyomorpha halys TaxID=286706 RepID=UPI0034D1A3B8